MGKKSVFDIDLLDTVTHRIIKSGAAEGRSSTEALKKFSKSLDPSTNLKEMRDLRYARYAFLWKKKK